MIRYALDILGPLAAVGLLAGVLLPVSSPAAPMLAALAVAPSALALAARAPWDS